MNTISSLRRAKGILAGLLGAICFGFIPLFSKPALALGMSPACVLTYRFAFAAIMLLILMLVQRIPVMLPRKLFPAMLLIAVSYSFSGGLLMLGFNYMSGGVTEVIHFTYPIWVMILLVVFFKERIKISSILAILIALAGIYCLGVVGSEESFIPGTNRVAGIIIVAASGLACASYMVGVNKTGCNQLHSLTISFWMLLLSSIFFLILSVATGNMVAIPDGKILVDFLCLAFVATVLSNFFVVYSIKDVGSTLASILGAVEPATAVVSCAIVFNEALTPPIILGICLILTGVAIVILRKKD